MRQRNVRYRSRWKELVDYYGYRCFYCRKEIATTIDHVVPYSWDQDSQIENLVPACALCNSIASNKSFEDVEHKRQYILRKRKARGLRHAICMECMLPFSYRTHSPSLLLCAECYDEEYGTKFSQRKAWRKWLGELYAAGIPAEAHRELKRKTGKYISTSDKEGRLEFLIDEYSLYADRDEEFARLLLYA